MGLPLPFLIGVLVLLVSEEIGDTLPGSASWSRVWVVGSLTMLLPLAVAYATHRWLRRAVIQRGRLPFALRLSLGLQWLVVPASYAVLVYVGRLTEVAVDLLAVDGVQQLLVLLGPLVVMEFSMRWAERPTVRWLDLARRVPPAFLGPDRLRMTAFVLVPILSLAAAVDLLRLHRGLEVFFTETSLGSTLGLLVMGALLCLALPLVFRWIMPVSSSLPATVSGDVRATAEALGFSGRRVLSMHTDHRMINAALVGPFAWPRYLVLTDGLLSLLDPLALRGVVAHEVGHAKANHPAWLVLVFACTPVLLLQPVALVDLTELDQTWLYAGSGLLVLLAWLGLRVLAHRFEYEADQLSAEALGGEEGCVRALLRVGELSPHGPHRSSFRHPSERRRIAHLRGCARDPSYRSRFWRRGRILRALVLAGLGASAGVFAWAQLALWPADRAFYLFHDGQLRAAERQVAVAMDSPAPQQEYLIELGKDLERLAELGIADAPWHELSEQIAARAYPRAEALLLRERDARAALPWLGLALYQRHPPAWRRALYRYCRAAEARDDAEQTRVAAHLRALQPGPPAAVLRAIDRISSG